MPIMAVLSYLTSLSEDIPASSDEVRSVEAWFELGCNKLTLSSKCMSLRHVLDRILLA